MRKIKFSASVPRKDAFPQLTKLQYSIIPPAKTPQNKNLLFIRTVTVDLYSSCAILESLDHPNDQQQRNVS
jgi:hypothetical protein